MGVAERSATCRAPPAGGPRGEAGLRLSLADPTRRPARSPWCCHSTAGGGGSGGAPGGGDAGGDGGGSGGASAAAAAAAAAAVEAPQGAEEVILLDVTGGWCWQPTAVQQLTAGAVLRSWPLAARSTTPLLGKRSSRRGGSWRPPLIEPQQCGAMRRPSPSALPAAVAASCRHEMRGVREPGEGPAGGPAAGAWLRPDPALVSCPSFFSSRWREPGRAWLAEGNLHNRQQRPRLP